MPLGAPRSGMDHALAGWWDPVQLPLIIAPLPCSQKDSPRLMTSLGRVNRLAVLSTYRPRVRRQPAQSLALEIWGAAAET